MPRKTESKLVEKLTNFNDELQRLELIDVSQETKIRTLKRNYEKLQQQCEKNEENNKKIYKFLLICLIVQTSLLLLLLIYSMNLV